MFCENSWNVLVIFSTGSRKLLIALPSSENTHRGHGISLVLIKAEGSTGSAQGLSSSSSTIKRPDPPHWSHGTEAFSPQVQDDVVDVLLALDPLFDVLLNGAGGADVVAGHVVNS